MSESERSKHMDTDFNTWMAEVDGVIERALGLTSRDLPDGPWRDYFGDEMPPKEAAVTFAEDGWLDVGQTLIDDFIAAIEN